MTGGLQGYFQQRGVPLTAVGSGPLTPVRFTDPVAEHLATRRAAGLFDFSFMGCFEFSGPGARRFLARVQTRNLARLRPGRLLYTLLLRADGTVFIDATLWDFGDGRYWLMTGRPGDIDHLKHRTTGLDVTHTDLSGRHAVLAVQGPRSHDILADLLGEPLFAVPYFGFHAGRVAGVPVQVARAGYSGEAGYELLVSAEHGPWLWNRIVRRYSPAGLLECGLEAIDTLRVEAGLILFLRELAWRVTPRMLNLGRLMDGPGLVVEGARALQSCAGDADDVRLVGLVPLREPLPVPDAVPPPNGLPIIPRGGALITSRAFSPTLGRVHALGFVHAADAWPGTLVTTSRGVRAAVARLPFYDPPKRRPRE
ncbi:MAG: aminomethyltransferase family protein [Thioalkalivibrio sp.]